MTKTASMPPAYDFSQPRTMTQAYVRAFARGDQQVDDLLVVAHQIKLGAMPDDDVITDMADDYLAVRCGFDLEMIEHAATARELAEVAEQAAAARRTAELLSTENLLLRCALEGRAPTPDAVYLDRVARQIRSRVDTLPMYRPVNEQFWYDGEPTQEDDTMVVEVEVAP